LSQQGGLEQAHFGAQALPLQEGGQKSEGGGGQQLPARGEY